MGLFSKISLLSKSISQLGLIPVGQNAIYQAGLASGLWRRLTPPGTWEDPDNAASFEFPIALPNSEILLPLVGSGLEAAVLEADEICQGQVRLFGGPAVPLVLDSGAAKKHWTEYERGRASWWGAEDPKLIWEAARFGWALALARAYRLTDEERYARTFWGRTLDFLGGNPPNLGPQWASGQEVAIRLIALVLCAGVFSTSPESTNERMALLGRAIAAHARRIPATLIYAQSQRNNHLVLEGAGLYTAGSVLPGHAQARRWKKTGMRLFSRALADQISGNGTYIQHSSNYHRLMLQAALWVHALSMAQGEMLPAAARKKLALAAAWLNERVDPVSGKTSNLGHNDGALLLPLAKDVREDYRPAAQAASQAFLRKNAFPPGPWDELACWLGLMAETAEQAGEIHGGEMPASKEAGQPGKRKGSGLLSSRDSLASLRAVRYTYRPGQADQLQVDIRWKGLPLTLDAGTYRYTAPSPWENNPLAGTCVHNTVMVDGKEQMTRAGRFLWLDWAQASLKEGANPGELIARHDGYRRLGIYHERLLIRQAGNNWRILDRLVGEKSRGDTHSATLHWLLPDYPWELQGTTLRLETPQGRITLQIGLAEGTVARTSLQLIRAGRLVAGRGAVLPVFGWHSPTYNLILPALSLRFTMEGSLPLACSSQWLIP